MKKNNIDNDIYEPIDIKKSDWVCPICEDIGTHSIYKTKDNKSQCTVCANKMRFGSSLML